MQMKIRIFLYVSFDFFIATGCNCKQSKSDAQGTFEADEVIVSSEVPGKILRLILMRVLFLQKIVL